MMLDTVLHVFRKDGTELLRDRRTIFVNAVLPVLLYPVLALFGIQMMQLTRTQTADLPRIATLDATELLTQELINAAEAMPEAADQPSETATPAPEASSTDSAETRGEAETEAEAEAATEEADEATGPRFVYHDLSDEQRHLLRPLIAALPGPDDPAPAEGEAAVPEAQREAALAALRSLELTALVSIRREPQPDGFVSQGMVVVVDDAHRFAPQVREALSHIFQRYEAALIAQRLSERGLPPDLVHPLRTTTLGVAPASEALRSKVAGVIPLLLVLMALSGAFYPALDLIAGERERGTLESLLSWPGNRRDLFLGKLLVVIVAAVISVLLNLASLGVTMVILGSQGGIGGEAVSSLAGGLSLGAGVLAMCFIALLPLVVTLSAVSLAVAGLAASFKEAQNYLSPLFLVVMVPAFVTMIPGAQPSTALDLVPVVGPLLALKESLQSPQLPWGHVLLATAASAALAAVVVAWSVRLLETERFLYPGLVRAGWGRFRQWGTGPTTPSGLEALAIFAVSLAGFLYLGPLFTPLGAAAQVAGPLVIGIALPAVLAVWLGGWKPRETFQLGLPSPADGFRTALLVPICVGLSLGLGMVQAALVGEAPASHEQEVQMAEIMTSLRDAGGLPLMILCMALAPGVCEELLCRGPLLSGLRRSLGTLGGVILSAFLFAALHGSPYRFVPQMILGMVLAVLVLRTRSIWPAMIVHFGHNALIVAAQETLGEEAFPDSPWLWYPMPAVALVLIWLILRGPSSRANPADSEPVSRLAE